MGLKRTWAEDLSPKVSPEDETMLRELEGLLNDCQPLLDAAILGWQKSPPTSSDSESYWKYIARQSQARNCYCDATGLLDIALWKPDMPRKVLRLLSANCTLHSMIRAIKNDTTEFLLGFEKRVEKGGLGDFIVPRDYYTKKEKMDFVQVQLDLRIERIHIGDRVMIDSRDEARASDVKARSFLFTWVKNFQRWIVEQEMGSMFDMPHGLQPHKGLSTWELEVADWGLFWDDVIDQVYSVYQQGSYDEFGFLCLEGSPVTFEYFEANDKVDIKDRDEEDGVEFEARKLYFSTPTQHRRQTCDLETGHPVPSSSDPPPEGQDFPEVVYLLTRND